MRNWHCRRFGIDNGARTLHGALLDSEILAEVYLELIGGRQRDLVLAGPATSTASKVDLADDWRPTPRPSPLRPRITEDERTAHAAFVKDMGDEALWKKLS